MKILGCFFLLITIDAYISPLWLEKFRFRYIDFQLFAKKPYKELPYKERKRLKELEREHRQPKESIEDLEKQVLGKYGSAAFTDYDWDDDEDDERDHKKTIRFEGFMPRQKPWSQSDTNSTSKFKSKPHKVSMASQMEIEAANIVDIDGASSREGRLLGRLKSRISTGTPAPTSVSVDSIEDCMKNGAYSDISSNVKIVQDDHVDTFEGFEAKHADDDYYEDGGSFIDKRIQQFEPTRYRLRPPTHETLKCLAERELKMERTKAAKAARKKRARETGEDYQWKEFTFYDNMGDKVFDDSIFASKTFQEIGVSDSQVLKNLEKMNIHGPTKIQELAIPYLQQNENVLIQAQTGSGKTLTFLLPLVDTINRNVNKVQCIILAPSRELVTQIASVANKLFENTHINTVPIIGGANIQNQVKRLRDIRPQIVVATPGRLAEIVFSLEKLKLGMVRRVIVDEVDNLMQEPYDGEVRMLIQGTPLMKRNKSYMNDGITNASNRSISKSRDISTENIDSMTKSLVLASATGAKNPTVLRFADSIAGVGQWKHVSVERETLMPTTISHGIISCPQIKAFELLKKFLTTEPAIVSALIFVNSPHRVQVVCDQLLEKGIIAAPLHGESSKDDRKQVLGRLRDGRLRFVVTTELAARGLDVPSLSHIVNFELPTDSQHYVHRAGRCGRAGRAGLVMNFARPDTKFVVRRFGKQLGVKLQDCEIRQGKVFLKIT
jgi:ATP-dependent RNA helicase DeaD